MVNKLVEDSENSAALEGELREAFRLYDKQVGKLSGGNPLISPSDSTLLSYVGVLLIIQLDSGFFSLCYVISKLTH